MEADRLTAVVGERTGRRVASLEPIAAGMGTRRFYRIHLAEGEPRTVVARCEPEATAPTANARGAESKAEPIARLVLPPAPAWLPEPPLEPLRTFLEDAGIPVPRSYGHFPDLGLELLEDVGPRNLLHAAPADREALYREACAIVPRLQRLTAPPERIPAFGRRYDAALLETKLWKWLHWAIPGLLGREPTTRELDDHDALFAAIRDELETAPRRLAHRDYKAENLHLRAGAAGGRPTLVLIDVQGAFVAPPEYDLVCLLYDLQTDLDEALATRLFAEVVPALPDHPSSQTARRRFDALAVGRLCKDVAHVVHAGLARGDRRRWHEIPRGLALLERAARRLESGFPGIPTLISVIHALTMAHPSADIPGEGIER
ncbi:MAG: phosphotransferase [Myxococcota bacterium]